MERPVVDSIEGLIPAISIEQKTTSRSPRSTVGTITEIYDYLRLLYASIGIPHCHRCGRPISRQTTDQIVASIMALRDNQHPRENADRSEEHTSELQSLAYLVCRLLLEKKKSDHPERGKSRHEPTSTAPFDIRELQPASPDLHPRHSGHHRVHLPPHAIPTRGAHGSRNH